MLGWGAPSYRESSSYLVPKRCSVNIYRINNAREACWQPQGGSPSSVPREGHQNGHESTKLHPGTEQGLPRAFHLHVSVLLHSGLHFFPAPKLAHLGRVPEPGFLRTHWHPQQPASEASFQLLTHCQTAAAGTCPWEMSGLAAFPACTAGKSEPAVSCLPRPRQARPKGHKK